MVLLFLHHRAYLDVGSEKPVIRGDRFTAYWSQYTVILKRASLFLLTISYLPVARVTLENFAGEYDPKILNLYGCHYVDNKNATCCLKAIPNRPCLSSPDFHGLIPLQVCVRITHDGFFACCEGIVRRFVLQYITIVFVVLYVIGLPLFFGRLVIEGVRRVNYGIIACQSAFCDVRAFDCRAWLCRSNFTIIRMKSSANAR